MKIFISILRNKTDISVNSPLKGFVSEAINRLMVRKEFRTFWASSVDIEIPKIKDKIINLGLLSVTLCRDQRFGRSAQRGKRMKRLKKHLRNMMIFHDTKSALNRKHAKGTSYTGKDKYCNIFLKKNCLELPTAWDIDDLFFERLKSVFRSKIRGKYQKSSYTT